ncbi:MAG: Helicase PriA essential for oriC/DnaA-independent DNA replication [Candidatus Kapaibacterium sp.]|nr:MAG: Helicase PriA essential for oriC/DnaA-independent DNA replication [Candidatus Kapabacteria bacterium]
MKKRNNSKNITLNYKTTLLVDVFPLAPVEIYYTYILETSEQKNFVGHRVVIPFNKRKIMGIIYQEHRGELDFDRSKLKKIIEVVDDKPIIPEKMFQLARWVADYYITPMGEVLKNIIPPKLKIPEKKYIQFIGVSDFEKNILNKTEQKIINFLKNRKNPVSFESLKQQIKTSKLEQNLDLLVQKGIVKIIRREKAVIPKKQVFHINSQMFSENVFSEYLEILKRKKALVQILQYLYELHKSNKNVFELEEFRKEFPTKNITKHLENLIDLGFIEVELKDDTDINPEYKPSFNFPNELILTLTKEQEIALNQITKEIENSKYSSFLLYGVTGSGKTLIYLHCIKKCLEMGKSAIVLVPEISLTPQLIERFNNAFPNQVAVLHSRLSDSQRVKQWISILNEEKKIVIGPRSAIFAPASNLGLIIVDEEHEPTYKQDEPAPRYNARDVALIRGKLENCVVILGSATPSINSYYAAKLGKHKLLTINERADGAKLPDIILVDMLEKRKQRKVFGQFSDTLIHKIIDRLTRKEGIILFQNRRGFGLLVECRFCGYIPKCPECEVSLTYHKSEQKLKCHYCGYERKYDSNCPKCGKTPMLILGYGTQRVEEELQSILSEFGYEPKIERYDLDVVVKSSDRNEIIQQFYFGEIDILVGTQLIAKGLDFERVTLVGIINADLQLNIPDFTANERAFQLFTQVAGRAGRRSTLPGEVVIQTTSPNAYPIQEFVNSNYDSFFKKELYYRKHLHYPPFFRLVSVEIQWKNENPNEELISFIKEKLDGLKNAIVLGPVIPIIPKIRGWNRKVFLVKINRTKDPNLANTTKFFRTLYNEFHSKFHSKKLKLIIDVDAQFSLL